MKSDNDALTVNCLLQNKVFDSAAVPLAHKPKSYQLDLDEIHVIDDEDPLAAGELRFWAEMQRRDVPGDDFVTIDERNTHTRSISSDSTVGAAMNAMNGSANPLAQIKLASWGRDYDSPGFPWYDNHDSLSTSDAQVGIGFDDAADGPLETQGGNYDLRGKLRTTSRPIKPVIQIFLKNDDDANFAVLNDDNTELELTGPRPVELEFRIQASWLAELTLRRYTAIDGSIPAFHTPEDKQLDLDLIHPRPLDLMEEMDLDDNVRIERNGESDHFTYYLTLNIDVVDNMQLSLVAQNVAGAVESDPVLIKVNS